MLSLYSKSLSVCFYHLLWHIMPAGWSRLHCLILLLVFMGRETLAGPQHLKTRHCTRPLWMCSHWFFPTVQGVTEWKIPKSDHYSSSTYIYIYANKYVDIYGCIPCQVAIQLLNWVGGLNVLNLSWPCVQEKAAEVWCQLWTRLLKRLGNFHSVTRKSL